MNQLRRMFGNRHARAFPAALLGLTAGLVILAAGEAVAAGNSALPSKGATGLTSLRESSGAEYIYALIDGGLFQAATGASGWTNVGATIPATRVQSFNVDASMLYVTTNDGGIFSSPDRGTTWTAQNTGLPCLNVRHYFVVSAGNHFATTHCGSDDTVYRSVDGGKSWSSLVTFGTGVSVNRIVPSATTGGRVWAATSGGIFMSADDGATWTMPANVSAPFAAYYAALPATSNVLDYRYLTQTRSEFMTIDGVGVYYTPDTTAKGAAIAPANTGLPGLNFGRRISILGARAHVSVLGYGVYGFANGSWSLVVPDSAVPQADQVIELASDANTWFARSRTNGVWKSSDAGRTWTLFGADTVTVAIPADPPKLSLPQGDLPASSVTVSVDGDISSLTLTADLKIDDLPQAFAAGYKVYVVALVPGAAGGGAPALFGKRADKSWAALSSPLAAFLENVTVGSQDSRVRIEILRDTDLSTLRSTEFYLGYGLDDAEMLRARRYRGIYKVE